MCCLLRKAATGIDDNPNPPHVAPPTFSRQTHQRQRADPSRNLDLAFQDLPNSVPVSPACPLISKPIAAISCAMRSCRLQLLWALPASKIGWWVPCAGWAVSDFLFNNSASLPRHAVSRPSPVQRSRVVSIARDPTDHRGVSATPTPTPTPMGNATSRLHQPSHSPHPPSLCATVNRGRSTHSTEHTDELFLQPRLR